MSIEIDDEKLLSLKADLKSYGNEIAEHISALYTSKRLTNDSISIDLKNDPANMLVMLKHELNQIIHVSQEKSEYALQHSSEISECSQLINVLTNLTSVTEMMIDCEKLISKFNFMKACVLVDNIEKALNTVHVPSVELASGKVLKVLSNEYKLMASNLNSKMKRSLNECIRFEHGQVSVSKQLKGMLRAEDLVLEDPLQLSQLWAALVLTGKADETVNELLRKFWFYVLQPVWAEKKVQKPRIVAADSEGVSELALDTVRDITGGCEGSKGFESVSKTSWRPAVAACKMPIPALLDCLGQLFGFLYAEVFCGNQEVAELAARRLCDPAILSITSAITESIAAHLPKHEAELPNFKKLLERPCRELETKFKLFGFLGKAATEEAAQPLTSYLQNLSALYADARRKEILKRAREIVLSDYHNTMVATGDALEDDPSSAGDIGDMKALLDQSGSFALQKLKFDSCQVSLSANRVLKLVHEAMRQACEASSPIANVLFQSARDCLEIFMAIVPMKFSGVIEATPRMGGVFYNDCLYIAHNTTLVAHRYRLDLGKVDEALQSTLGFVDFIPRFRTLGEQCLRSHLEDQRAALSGLVRSIRLSTDGETESVKPTALYDSLHMGINSSSSSILNDERSAERVRAHMERLSHQWLGVLQEEVYCRVVGHLLEGILRDLMAPALVADCISVEGGAEMGRVYKTIQKIRLVFPSEFRGDDSLQAFAPSWKKFLSLTELLEFSLGDVAEWLPRKKFATFSGQEISMLIRALFEDTPKRQSILQSILAMSS